MASFTKDAKGRWMAKYTYVDWQGNRRFSSKRGFATKREAQEWYQEFLDKESSNLDMNFATFVEIYFNDMSHRLKENTLRHKKFIVNSKIIPYFGKKQINKITAPDVRRWQNEMMGQKLAPTTLKSIQNQLSAIFNYAVRFYDLACNPCQKAGSMGVKNAEEMQFWTLEEFNSFLETQMDDRQVYMIFELLFWTGMRVGEALALNYHDFDLVNKTVSISKSYQRIEGRDVITTPKTKKSKRVIGIPDFVVTDLQDLFDCIFAVTDRERVFTCSKMALERAIKSGAKIAGIKQIRVHDLRHSHATMLINMGMNAKVIADRLGHERIETTLNTYSHLYSDTKQLVVSTLESLNKKFVSGT